MAGQPSCDVQRCLIGSPARWSGAAPPRVGLYRSPLGALSTDLRKKMLRSDIVVPDGRSKALEIVTLQGETARFIGAAQSKGRARTPDRQQKVEKFRLSTQPRCPGPPSAARIGRKSPQLIATMRRDRAVRPPRAHLKWSMGLPRRTIARLSTSRSSFRPVPVRSHPKARACPCAGHVPNHESSSARMRVTHAPFWPPSCGLTGRSQSPCIDAWGAHRQFTARPPRAGIPGQDETRSADGQHFCQASSAPRRFLGAVARIGGSGSRPRPAAGPRRRCGPA